MSPLKQSLIDDGTLCSRCEAFVDEEPTGKARLCGECVRKEPTCPDCDQPLTKCICYTPEQVEVMNNATCNQCGLLLAECKCVIDFDVFDKV